MTGTLVPLPSPVTLAEATQDVPCPCGRGTAIGTCCYTGTRLLFRAFRDGVTAFHLGWGADWACADCVADIAVSIASDEVHRQMVRDSMTRPASEEGSRP